MSDLHPHWDQDLSAEQVIRLSPKNKALRSRTSLIRKIDILEDWNLRFHDLSISEDDVKWERSDLRNWHDPLRHLWKWGFKNVDLPDTGPNHDVMKRFAAVLKELREKFSNPSHPKNLKSEMKAKDKIIVSLKLQNLELLNRITILESNSRNRKIGAK